MKIKYTVLVIFGFLIYILWYAEAIGTMQMLLYGGSVAVVLSTAIYINSKNMVINSFSKELKWWVAFDLYSLMTGIVFASDKVLLLKTLITYTAFLIVVICINLVLRGEKKANWLIIQMIIVCVVCALYTVFHGYNYYNGVIVTTMGPENNPNTLGALMVFGIFCVMYNIEPVFNKLIKATPIIILFAYIIILTGSKKALLSAAILIVIWIIGVVKSLHYTGTFEKKIPVYAMLVFATVWTVSYFRNKYLSTASYVRMLHLQDSGSTEIREKMYSEAIRLFCENPITGIGFAQFRVESIFNTYSHSTYAELISCSGLIGTFLFVFPIVSIGDKLIKYVKNNKTYKGYTLLGIYCVELFLGAVNIFYYEFTHLLMWTIIFYLVNNLADERIDNREA